MQEIELKSTDGDPLSLRISHDEDGNSFVTSDQPMSATIGELKSIGVRNILDIANYQVENVNGQIKHTITFRDGGSATVVIADGKFNLETTALSTNIQDGSILMLSTLNTR